MAPSASTTVTYHEFGHGILIWMKGLNNTPYDGMWHEGWANFSEEQVANDIDPSNMLWCHSFFLPHGRDYYDSWVFWENLRENTTYGPTFLTTLFQQCQGSAGEYVFDAMTRLDTSGSADHQNAIKDLVGQYARKNITWDYERGDMMRNYSFAPNFTDPLSDQWRKVMTELVKEAGSTTTYRIPCDHAPSQGGYSVIPIKLTSKSGGAYSVGVNFKPLANGVRASDFRCTLVAVSDNGNPRYSTMWNVGANTITLSAYENKLYLVVAATPSFLGDTGRLFLNQPAVAPQEFEISLVSISATIWESVPAASHTGMHHHSNGAGWVSDTATVDSTAYVGPNAMVLDSAHVHNTARIEDYAVVRGNADVRDNALITGHALVKDSAQVYGYGKVRDWATVCGSAQVYEYGRVLEHAWITDSAKYHGNATGKGNIQDFGSAEVYGYAIKEGDCSNYANFDHGVLMCWVWGIDQAFADSQPDIAGLYCGYDFETYSPVYAMDKYGIIHGYLMGSPTRVLIADTYRSYTMQLNGTSQYSELHKDVNDFKDTTIAMWVKWTGTATNQRIFSFGNGSNKYMYLTPKDSSTSKLRFVITNGTTTQYLDGTAVLTANSWQHIAITFSGSNDMKSSFTAPAGITASGDWTVAVWAYNPGIDAKECTVSWADRSAGSRCMQFNYGNASGWGAATHMSNDLGWAGAIAPTAGQWHHLVLTFAGGTNGAETVYVDGVSNNTAVKTLNLFTGEYVFLGCATDNSSGTPSHFFSGSLAKVQTPRAAPLPTHRAAVRTAHAAAGILGARARLPTASP